MSNIILLVEDDLPTCALWERHLTHQGWEVQAAHDFDTAEDAVLRYQPAAIILDVILGDHRSGWDLLTKVRSWKWSQQLPVLIVSAVDEPNRARAIGANGFLLKPCSPSTVIARIQDFLYVAEQAQSA